MASQTTGSWWNDRLPIRAAWRSQLTNYPAPKNFNFWYFFGSLLLLVLATQLASGVFLAIHYQPNPDLAYWSVLLTMMRDTHWGWLIRYIHTTGATAFFVLLYLHMYRGIMYGSYKRPRELVWIFGVTIYLVLSAESVLGYLLPWGQMSYWGSTAVMNFATAIPGIGNDIATWLRGSFVVGLPTLNRFFVFHVFLIPFVLIAVILLHMIALHQVGSNNPDGIEIHDHRGKSGWPVDAVPFQPYFTVKDSVGVGVFLLIFFWFVFFAPQGGGVLIDKLNYTPANPIQTPPDIHPLWYFLPYYAVLRGIPEKFYGVLAFAFVFVMLFALPLLDRNPIRSIRYRSALYKLNVVVLPLVFVWMGFIASGSATEQNMVYGMHVTEVLYCTFWFLPYFNKPRPRWVTVAWFVVFEALIWLIDFWMFATHAHGWPLMVRTTWIPALYVAIVMLSALAWPRLAHDAPRLPERLTAGGLLH
ncbi:MAG: cytochrome b N-terminal domain-containing protein [Ideonella sp.]|nr:MAG: cytochrome b [Burkholderiaceae bacterium]MBE7426453.1 cytochrome b N-terminal domain-containing protein [Ideonella sp.]